MATPTEFKKLTDPAIPNQSGTVATNDLLHTVDVSDTSGGASGTSKRTTIQKVIDVVESSLNLESGTWTPTLDGAEDAASNPVLDKAQYLRIGNILTCTIKGTIDLDFTSDISGRFIFTYPFVPSTNNSIGTTAVETLGEAIGLVTENIIVFQSTGTSTFSAAKFYAIFQYEID